MTSLLMLHYRLTDKGEMGVIIWEALGVGKGYTPMSGKRLEVRAREGVTAPQQRNAVKTAILLAPVA